MLIIAPTRITLNKVTFKDLHAKYTFFKPVIDTLIAKGADSAYMYSLALYPRTQFSERYVKINVTGYLNKPDYSVNLKREAIIACKMFMQNYSEILSKAEYYYEVPKEIITSILWIESKLGNFTGSNHIPSVFFSTAMVTRPEFLWLNLEALKESLATDTTGIDSLRIKLILRSKTKMEWAVNELLHLDKIRKKLPESTLELEGSWAGAFGYAQFLPSSYFKWAVDGNSDGKIDLFDMEDAICSIANYLRAHGWKNDSQNQRSSVFAYNNSNDYVDAVFNLSNRIKI